MSIPQPTIFEGDVLIKTNVQPLIHGKGDLEVEGDVVIRGNLDVQGDHSVHDVTTIVTTDNIMGIGEQPITFGQDKGILLDRHPTDIVAGPDFQLGTAQAGGVSTITLSASASGSDDFYNDMYVKITAGPGVGEFSQITDYDGVTKIADVAPWTIEPTAASTYTLYAAVRKGIIWDESDDVFAMVGTTDDHTADIVNIRQYCDLKVNSIIQTQQQQCIYYVGKHGVDTNTGLHINEARLTFTSALTSAIALSPDADNKVAIICFDSCKYVEDITITSFVHVVATSAHLNGTIVLNNNTSVEFAEQSIDSGTAVVKTSASGSAKAIIDKMMLLSTADGVYNTGFDSQLKFHNSFMSVDDGIGVENDATGDGYLNVHMCDILITGTGTAVLNSNTTPLNAVIQQITENGVGGPGIALWAATGRINALMNRIDATVACRIDSGATINLYIDEISGAEVLAVGAIHNKLPAVEVRNHLDDDTTNPHCITINQANAKEALLTTKGDLFVYNGVSVVRLPVGADGQHLEADAAAPAGVKWSNVSTIAEYPLTINHGKAQSRNYKRIGNFTWLNSRYAGYSLGIVVYRVIITNRSLDIRLYDVTNSTTLGSATGVSASGFYTFPIINPVANADIELQIRKNKGGGTSPLITSSVLEFNT